MFHYALFEVQFFQVEKFLSITRYEIGQIQRLKTFTFL